MENEVTYFFFLSHTKNYLKQLITNPSSAEIDDEFKSVLSCVGVSQEEFLSLLLKRGIIERKEKVDDDIYKGHEKATFSIKYQVPRKNFERKIQKLHIELFPDEKVELNEGAWGYGILQNDSALDKQDEFGKESLKKLSAGVCADESGWSPLGVLFDFIGKYKEDELGRTDEYKSALELVIKTVGEMRNNKDFIKHWSDGNEMKTSLDEIEKEANKIMKKNFPENKKENKKPEITEPEKKEEINEDGGGATACEGSSGAFETPVFPVQRRKIYMTREQFERIQEAVEVDNRFGEFGYDAPGLAISKDDPTMKHRKKNGGISWERVEEEKVD